MYLKEITLQNWKGLTGTVPIHKRAWVHGQTGEGKTAIFEAIRFLYEGRVSCGARPKDVGKYVAGRSATVTGVLDDGFAWTRTVAVSGDGKVAITTVVEGATAKNSTQADAMVFAKTGRYGPCFAMSEWLSLTPEKIREQLTQLADSMIDTGTIKARARVLAIAELIGADVMDGIAMVVLKGDRVESASADQLEALAREASAKVPAPTMDAIDRTLNRSLTGEKDLATALPIVLDLLADAKSSNKKEYKLVDQQRASAADMVGRLSKDPVSVDELRKSKLALAVRRDELLQQIGNIEGVAAALANEKQHDEKLTESILRVEDWLRDHPAPDLAAINAETTSIIDADAKACEERQAWETQVSFHRIAKGRASVAANNASMDAATANVLLEQLDRQIARILANPVVAIARNIEKALSLIFDAEPKRLLEEAIQLLGIRDIEAEHRQALADRERAEASVRAAEEARGIAESAVRRADKALGELQAKAPPAAAACDAAAAARARVDEAKKQAALVLTAKEKMAALRDEQDRCRERIGVLNNQSAGCDVDDLKAERDSLRAKAHEIDEAIEAAAGREGMLKQFADLRDRCDVLLCEGVALDAVIAAIKTIRDTTLLDITAPLRSEANALLGSLADPSIGEIALVFSAPSGAPVFDVLYHPPNETEPRHYDALAEGEQCLIRAALAYGLVKLTSQQASKILLLEASSTSLRPAARIAEMLGRSDAPFPILVCHHTMQCVTPPWQEIDPAKALVRSRRESGDESHG